MARNKWYLRAGTAFQTNTNQSKSNNFGFDLEKYVKKTLRHFNVDAHDACCGSTINEEATATVEQVEQGVIYSTNEDGAFDLTLPDTEDFNEIKGRVRYFTVDNTGGDHDVTLVVGAGMTAASAITGGDNLVVASGTIGKFQIYFSATDASIISRLV